MIAYEALRKVATRLGKQLDRVKGLRNKWPEDNFYRGVEDGLIAALEEISELMIELKPSDRQVL